MDQRARVFAEPAILSRLRPVGRFWLCPDAVPSHNSGAIRVAPDPGRVIMNIRYRTSLTTAAVGLALLPLGLTAQNITLKTVPIPTGEQFLLFPSLRLGMGSVSIALDDSVAAPFANPARRLAEGRARVYATPTFYGETNQSVGGRSLPIAALFAGERFQGGFAVALQQVNDPARRFVPVAD